MKSMKQFAQVQIANRLQEYVPDFKEGNTEGAPVTPGLGSITHPIQFVQATEDESCPAKYTDRLRDRIGDAVVK